MQLAVPKDNTLEAVRPWFLILSLIFSGLLLNIGLLWGWFSGLNSGFLAICFAALVIQAAATVYAISSITTIFNSFSDKVSLLLLLQAAFIIGLAPPTEVDALVHHLAVPRFWIEFGFIHEIPWHEWSYYPMLSSIAYTALLIVGKENLAASYQLSCLILTLAVVGTTALKLSIRPQVARTAILLLATSPIILRLAASQLVDLNLMLYCALACMIFVVTFSGKQTYTLAAAFGLTLGLCASVKYNGVLFAAFMLAGFTVFTLRNKTLKVSSLLVSTALLTLVLAFSPWLLRDYLWTGNPIFPLAKSIFQSHLSAAGSLVSAPNPLMHRSQIYGESFLELILLPFRMFCFGADGSGRSFDGALAPALLFSILIFGLKDQRPILSLKALLAISILFISVALYSGPARVRYLAPILPVFALAAAYSLETIASTGRFAFRLVSLVMTMQIMIAGFYQINRVSKLQPFGYLSGQESKDSYLNRLVPEYGLINFVNANLKPDSDRVWLLGTANPFYYFEIPVYSSGYYSFSQLESWLLTPELLEKKISGLGITHLFFQSERADRQLTNSAHAVIRERWQKFSNNFLTPVAGYKNYSVWAVKSTR